ncbi:Lysophospholipase; Monoglyceride lipase; putative [Mycetocola reblochoni REB411]|uniref:Lysophospholipase Monoglyceride lipase putative n=1 Tax=Mycetocola reblochoni REB411 TaxID=1255698 RepID=A0A1R4ITA9_9MICO|nr:Lysophospholipase; Monoglyceride lipase; putative [Mycetocola reblochoni REB411]
MVTDRDGVPIVLHEWPVDRPTALVHIVHGVGEHAARYAPLAAALNAAGYAVVADDHRGHGETGLRSGGLGVLGPGSVAGAMDSVQHVGERLVAESGDTPVVLLGHSWGSLMAQKIVARTPLYDGVALSGTSLAIPGLMTVGDLNRPWRSADASGLEWLSRSEEARRAFAADPLCFDIAETPVWTPLQALALLGRPPRQLPRRIPILIQGGQHDSLGGERGLRALYTAYRERSGATDIAIRVYPEARHEIYNELNRDEVVGDLVAWLDGRFARRTAPRA